jgi:hypothetical protein
LRREKKLDFMVNHLLRIQLMLQRGTRTEFWRALISSPA